MRIILALLLTFILQLSVLAGKHHKEHAEHKIEVESAIPIVTAPHIWATMEGKDYDEAMMKIKSDRPELKVVKLNQV